MMIEKEITKLWSFIREIAIKTNENIICQYLLSSKSIVFFYNCLYSSCMKYIFNPH